MVAANPLFLVSRSFSSGRAPSFDATRQSNEPRHSLSAGQQFSDTLLRAEPAEFGTAESVEHAEVPTGYTELRAAQHSEFSAAEHAEVSTAAEHAELGQHAAAAAPPGLAAAVRAEIGWQAALGAAAPAVTTAGLAAAVRVALTQPAAGRAV